jgi:flagellar basal body-associated protein FliL
LSRTCRTIIIIIIIIVSIIIIIIISVIIITLFSGDNQHIGLREGLRKLPMEQNLPNFDPTVNVELTTPPRVLTLEQRFPTVDDSRSDVSKPSRGDHQERQITTNGHL